MFSNLTIGKRLALGFGVVLTLLVAVALWAVFGIGGVVSNAEQTIAGNELRAEMTQREVDHLNWANQVSALITDENVTELSVETNPKQCAFGKWYYSEARRQAEELVPQLKPLLAAIETPHNDLHASAVEIGEIYVEADVELGNFLRQAKVDHLVWAHRVKDAFVDSRISNLEGVEFDPTKCAFGRWYYSDEVAQLKHKYPEIVPLLDAIEEPHKKLHTSAVEVERLLRNGQRAEASSHYLNTIKIVAYEVLEGIDATLAWNDARVEDMNKAQRLYASATKENLTKVQGLLDQIRETAAANIMSDQEMLNAASGTQVGLMILSLISIAAGIVLAFLLGRAIVSVLGRIIAGLGRGSEQVAAASGQVASSSQQMAEGASEQASSLEEISSSLEELSSMTKQNADSAKQANTLAGESRDAAERGNQAMERMSDAINRIKSSSDETAKIVKTIDEIAFQTNLLALNAAVEAARAGDAGKGFAVVAEEVRNLAQRSAEAAKSTAALIEESQVNADNGVNVSDDVAKLLTEMVGSSESVAGIIAEVSAASEEQSQGIEQINTAVAEMDKVTQSNAANAEESASASEELSAQASELDEMVGDLRRLAGGASTRTNGKRKSLAHADGNAPAFAGADKAHTLAAGGGNGRKATAASLQHKVIRADQVIPLDDTELSDF